MKREPNLKIRVPWKGRQVCMDYGYNFGWGPHCVPQRVGQLLMDAGAPVAWRNGKIEGSGHGFCEVEVIPDSILRVDTYYAYWDAAPRLDDPDVIDLEIVEEGPALPAGT
jgi:hypothetical protein